MKRLTREWVQKAESDLRAAHALAVGPRWPNDIVTFHCQQSAEKYLKALLQEAGQPVPKIHNLQSLQTQLLPLHPSLRPLRRGLTFLTRFAVDARYPGFPVSRRQAVACLHWADRVREKCRELLGVRT